jgi:BMFP domain-containing protein YqiC
MQDKDFLNNLTQKLCHALPAHLQDVTKDIKKNFFSILDNTFEKLDLVTRQEFDAQTKVLARSRKKIEALEESIKNLEKIVNDKITR